LPPGDFADWLNGWEARKVDSNSEIETGGSVTQWH
jgi:hypothetical protein